ncbi:phosphatase PAP2 family protein [Cellulomonas soli]|uniref:phosphatase PAP2 family protein n=1 Tax=Cellulomonas soli TaxID=931535 RepID=UPI003F87B6F3
MSAPTSRARRLVRAVLAALGTAAVVLLLALLVREQWPPLVRFDERVVTAATQLTASTPGLAPVLLGWQWAFAASRLFVPVAALCLLFWWRTGRRTRTWWALSTILAAWVVANVAKELVQRARPVLDEPVANAPGYSFPSGHATNTAAMTTALVVLAWPVLRTGSARVAAVLTAVGLTVLTAADRVLLGVHYPSDVIAGTLLGTGFVIASYLGYRGWSHRPEATRTATPPPALTEVPR